MKNSVLFFLILIGFVWAVEEPVGGDGAAPQTNTEDSKASADAEVASHVKDFIDSNPQVASQPVAGSSSSGPAATMCECAVFNTETPFETDKPIITQAPMSVSCDSAGEENCNKLCTALAEAAKGRGPQMLCSILGHYDKLKASVHSRICGATNWTYTGLTAPTELCCHDHQVIDCKDQVTSAPQNQL